MSLHKLFLYDFVFCAFVLYTIFEKVFLVTDFHILI